MSEKRTLKIKQATKQGYIECELPGVADFSYPKSKTRRGRVQAGGANMSHVDGRKFYDSCC